MAVRLELLTYLKIETDNIRSVISYKNNARIISGTIKVVSVLPLNDVLLFHTRTI